MKVWDLNIFKMQQQISNSENKLLYGEVYTPYELIAEMIEMIPESLFKNPNLKWLDPGSGYGYFSIFLFHKLFISLVEAIPEPDLRRDHIIENMITMVEINEMHITVLKELFGEKCNIINMDFLELNTVELYDIIIGNPPYNSNGKKKVPTNTELNKKADGSVIWPYFIRKSMALLKKDGYLCVIIPSIWMKPDKLKMYEYLTQYDIQKLKCLTNTETNKYFKGNAQTPTCYFLLNNSKNKGSLNLYDKTINNYISFSLYPGIPIPVFGASILNKLLKYTEIYGTLNVKKTNLPSKEVLMSTNLSSTYYYSNIKTCILEKNKPKLALNYSDKPCPFHGKPKIILAHKMYGFPYIDIGGIYGISNRDNYVILERNLLDMVRITDFFSTKLALYLFECTRYRMKYLEKYIFELIPDITKIPNFPEYITDESAADFFGFSLEEKEGIQKLHKKTYERIINNNQ